MPPFSKAVALEGVKSGNISFSVGWTETVQSDSQVHTLVERDPEIRAILKDVRKQMDGFAEREAKQGRDLPDAMPGCRPGDNLQETNRCRECVRIQWAAADGCEYASCGQGASRWMLFLPTCERTQQAVKTLANMARL